MWLWQTECGGAEKKAVASKKLRLAAPLPRGVRKRKDRIVASLFNLTQDYCVTHQNSALYALSIS
jgi:hypothetical protein